MRPEVLADITRRALMLHALGDARGAMMQGVTDLAEAHAEGVFLAVEQAIADANCADVSRFRKRLIKSSAAQFGGFVREEFGLHFAEDLRPAELAAIERAGITAYRSRMRALLSNSSRGGRA